MNVYTRTSLIKNNYILRNFNLFYVRTVFKLNTNTDLPTIAIFFITLRTYKQICDAQRGVQDVNPFPTDLSISSLPSTLSIFIDLMRYSQK